MRAGLLGNREPPGSQVRTVLMVSRVPQALLVLLAHRELQALRDRQDL